MSSPDLYADLYENAPDLFLSVDGKDGRIRACNRMTLETLGYTADELVGTPIFRLAPDSEVPRYRALFQEFQRTGVIRNGEVTFLRKDGTGIPVSINASAVRDDEGNILFSRSVVRDMTEHKRMERELAAAYRERERIMNSISDYLWSAEVDETGQSFHRYYSPVVERVTGYPPEYFLEGPHRWFGTIHPEDQPRVRELLAHILAGEVDSLAAEYRVFHADGRVRWIRDTVVVDPQPNGRMILNGVASDVTADHETEKERAARETELAHVTRLSTLGELIAGIAHEINQPLSAISLLAGACEESLRRGNFDRERFLEWIQDIERQARACGDIVSRIKTFARKADREPVRVDMNGLVLDSVKLLGSAARHSGVEVTTALEDPAPVALGNRLQLQQVVVNLLQNAYDSMSRAPRKRRRVIIYTSTLRDQVEVRIEDFGGGLPAERDVFEPFFTTKREGLGMGLAICRSIVEAHGGTLRIESKAGRGAVASFAVDRAPEDPDEDPGDEPGAE